jgi:protease PrsW
MAFFVALVLSFVPAVIYAWVVYWLDRYEKEPRFLLGGIFLWGAVVATFGAIIASMLLEAGMLLMTGSEVFADLSGTTIIAPLVEESLKGLAVLIIFLAFRTEFDSILDGIVYASVAALGFAATENVLYLYFQGYVEGDGWNGLMSLFVLRVLFGGWNHAVYTSFIGIGLALTRLSRRGCVKFLAPVVGWILAMTVHGLHNTMSVFLISQAGLSGMATVLLGDWLSWLIMFLVVVWAIMREKRWTITYLPEEVTSGIITQRQFEIARSSWAQVGTRLRALKDKRYKTTRHFYQLCAELAQKKHQLETFGKERGNDAIIERLRVQLAKLSPNV